jgi:hypothetical protein
MASKLTQMNGKPFTHFTYTDFGTPGRRQQIGRHTSLEVAARTYYRDIKGVYENPLVTNGKPSRVWLEDAQGNEVPYPPYSLVRTRKTNLRP